MQGALQFHWQLRLAAYRLGTPAFFWQVIVDPEPEVTIGGLLAAHGIVCYRHPRHLDDAALDGIDQRKIGDHPGKEDALAVAGASQKEGGSREVEDHLDPQFGLDSFQPGDPDPGILVLALSLLPFISPQHDIVITGLAAVAMVGLVVNNDDILLGTQVAADPPYHLIGGFSKEAWPILPQDALGQFTGIDLFPQFEGMEVGDQDSGTLQFHQPVIRQYVALPVVILWIVREQHPQAVSDGDARGDD